LACGHIGRDFRHLVRRGVGLRRLARRADGFGFDSDFPETLSYSVVAAVGITILGALFTAATGPHDLVSAVLVLAIALGIYWLIGRHPATIVTAKQAAATGACMSRENEARRFRVKQQ